MIRKEKNVAMAGKIKHDGFAWTEAESSGFSGDAGFRSYLSVEFYKKRNEKNKCSCCGR